MPLCPCVPGQRWAVGGVAHEGRVAVLAAGGVVHACEAWVEGWCRMVVSPWTRIMRAVVLERHAVAGRVVEDVAALRVVLRLEVLVDQQAAPGLDQQGLLGVVRGGARGAELVAGIALLGVREVVDGLPRRCPGPAPACWRQLGELRAGERRQCRVLVRQVRCRAVRGAVRRIEHQAGVGAEVLGVVAQHRVEGLVLVQDEDHVLDLGGRAAAEPGRRVVSSVAGACTAKLSFASAVVLSRRRVSRADRLTCWRCRRWCWSWWRTRRRWPSGWCWRRCRC